MLRTLLKSPIHCASIKSRDLNDEGSGAIDEDLIDAAHSHPVFVHPDQRTAPARSAGAVWTA
jgi:Aspartate decarboxylase